jgi:catechol 2,3-dioxygenase-like lactoylglutathione lyase family enzyme
MPNDRFDHVFVEPASYDASLRFYRDVLGWRVAFSWGGDGEPRGASVTSGAMSIVLAEPHPAEDKSKSHGINGTRRWFVARDPDGNLIAFEQRA